VLHHVPDTAASLPVASFPREQRFSSAQIRAMCSDAGLVDLRFSQREPYWCVMGVKAES